MSKIVNLKFYFICIWLILFIFLLNTCREPDDDTTPILFVSTETLDFGESDNQKEFEIKNNTDEGGNGTLSFNIAPTQSWISVSPETGDSQTEKKIIVVTVDRTGLSYGTHTGEIDITSNGGEHNISVTMDNIAPNEAPQASFTVTASGGGYTYSDFSFDATSTTDDSDDLDALQVRWEWQEGEGYTAWTYQKTMTRQYESPGSKSITLEVKDSEGLIGSSTQSINVAAPSLAEVNTITPVEITHNSVQLNGNLLSLGTGAVMVSAHGFCWSESSGNLNIENASFYDIGEESTLGEFSHMLTGLNASTTYYFKAYATNSAGTSYGDIISFTTTIPVAPDIVSTSEVTDILQTTAQSLGIVHTIGMGVVLTQHGHCWSSGTQTPVVSNDPHTSLGQVAEPGGFSSSLTGLSNGTLYYIRAYVTTSDGEVVYGNVLQFNTLE